MPAINLEIDRVLQYILPHITRYLSQQSAAASFHRPFKLAVTGLQGSGKSTWSSQIVEVINKKGLKARTLSLDDLYLPHEGLIAVRDANPENKLLRTRGQPGTHDVELAKWFFQQFEEPTAEPKLFPIFDKSKFHGEGDRLPKSEWHTSPPDEIVDVLVFEGWCVGFRPLQDDAISAAWNEAKNSPLSHDDFSKSRPIKTLANHGVADLRYINGQLGTYCDFFMGPQHWDYMVHLDTDDLRNVYAWRLEQETFLRQTKGTGMSDNAVVEFIKGYMPAYELYLGNLRKGFFQQNGSNNGCQLSIKLGEQRQIVDVREI
ncbi:hypothetical protein TWF694_000939 [Orbilia ellipsospora]|uniref:D-glycerate 3-kinase n=1 Tax=Orbilia ellipsospora TaxID=2528407 RepID=A0AAV9XRX8_9PEZI